MMKLPVNQKYNSLINVSPREGKQVEGSRNHSGGTTNTDSHLQMHSNRKLSDFSEESHNLLHLFLLIFN